MRNLLALYLLATVLHVGFAFAAPDPIRNEQSEYERDIGAIVRNKLYFKQGRMEVGFLGGVMPYDSLINHYTFGGKFQWHLSDHYGWEVADVHMALGSVTAFTRNLVREKGLSNLQTTKIKLLASSNFLISPVYGKIRFFGSQVLYFDVYFVVGLGMANTETIKLASTGQTVEGVETVANSGFDPMFDFGIGFKIFATSNIGILIDMRDYVISSTSYGDRHLKSNFTVSAGASFIFPGF